LKTYQTLLLIDIESMKFLSPAISRLARLRSLKMDHFIYSPCATQEEVFLDLINHGQETEFGKKYRFDCIFGVESFKEHVPLQDYEDLKPYIDRIIAGEENLLWDSPIRWFAKSSGTTSDKSKFIPVTQDSLDDCHYRAGRDVLTLYYNNYPKSDLLTGKSLVIGGSHQVNQLNELISYGDLSAVILQNMPFYGHLMRTPDLEVALMGEWEQKIDRIARDTINENVSSIAGVPSWTIVLLKYILKLTGKSDLREVWPNLELYLHGGVSFTPYETQFNKFIKGSGMHYQETYNASEGFFAAQDNLKENKGMMLLLQHGIFYEFMPLEEYGKEQPKTLQLNEVEIGKSYAMVITTNGGLWRYLLGDTIQFTTTYPFRIEITGRVKSFINAFGEEVVVENADKAIAAACKKTGAIINDYTVAPIFFSDQDNGAHEWLIEFDKVPDSIASFTQFLDHKLQSINSDYESKRYKDIALRMPEIKMLPVGTFSKWLDYKDKLGGQHKVPRLCNNRKYVEEILEIIK